MTIAERSGDTVDIIRDEHNIARLGQGLSESGSIADAAVARATGILEQYADICHSLGVREIDAVATSALRDATNSDVVRAALETALQSQIRVISGADEARLSFQGAVDTDAWRSVLDVGGGSTEVISGQNRDIERRRSLQMGAVRFTDRFFTGLPPSATELEAARAAIRTQFENIEWNIGDALMGVGGTATSLAALHLDTTASTPEMIHGQRIATPDVVQLADRLLAQTLDELLADSRIHPKRADVLPMGALIVAEALRSFEADEFIVSAHGLRYGVLHRLIQKSVRRE